MSHLAGKDAYTELHTRRVALRAVQVGEQLGLSGGRLRSLAIGGLLHDMGKLSVPDEILQKPGPLTDEEYAVIRRHPEWGQALVRELGGFPAEVERLVMDHHERLDGTGYPRGLGEDYLDLETRILSVCDVYDALMSKRVYRDAWSHEAAMALLHEESGTAFDPRCVAALEQVLDDEHAAEPVVELAPSAGLAPAAPEAVRGGQHRAQVAGGRGGDRRLLGRPVSRPAGGSMCLTVGERQVGPLERARCRSTTTLIVAGAALEAAGREHERLRAHRQAVALVDRRRRRSG